MERIHRMITRTAHPCTGLAEALFFLALCAFFLCPSPPAWALTDTNSVNIAGDWDGTAADDHYTNTATGTIGGTADMTQGGSDVFVNSGAITNFIRMSSDGHNVVYNYATGVVGSPIYGSYNVLGTDTGGHNIIYNYGTAPTVYGSYNNAVGASGGDNEVNIYSGSAIVGAYGSFNVLSNTNGGSNTIYNEAAVTGLMGSGNMGDNSYGSYNTITNAGTVTTWIYGSINAGSSSSGGSNTIINSGTATNIAGTFNSNAQTSGGSNIITNSGTVTDTIYGTYNSINSGQGGSNTITNTGTADVIYGSYNVLDDTSGGFNVINNSGWVAHYVFGSQNAGVNSSGGSNTITNRTGGFMHAVWGSQNAGDNSSGGFNTITNQTGATINHIQGNYNEGANSSGGGNTINNSGTVGNSIYGSYNSGANSSGGSNNITSSGSVGDSIIGSYNLADDTSGGSNTITNAGTTDYIDGDWSIGDRSSGGSNTITNTASGRTTNDIFGSSNDGVDSTGGSNTITNAGTAGLDVYGSYNHGASSIGGSNYIYNTGMVLGSVYGSYNEGANSVGGGNYVSNSGTVYGSIYGSYNTGAGASATGNTINNSGRVWGSIHAGTGDDTVYITGGSSVGGVIDGQDGTDTLHLSASGTHNANKYLNFENAGYTGQGVTTLTGGWSFNQGMAINSGQTTIANSTYASLVNVNGGVLNMAGVLTAGGVNVNTGGYLNGTGTINSNVAVGGTISPGNSIGTLNITGSYTSQAGSVYACELASGGSSDLINAGSAVLNGGTVMAYLDSGISTSSQAWTILTTSGTLSGTYDTIESPSLVNSRVLSLALAYTDNSVSVVFIRASYASFGTTPNNRIVGAALDGIAPLATANGDDMATLLEIVDWTFSEAQIDSLLAACNPEMYDGLSWAALAGARRFGAAMQNRADWGRMARLLGAPLEARSEQYAGSDWSVWARAIGDWDRRAGDSGYLGYEADTGGVVLGADGAVLPWLRVGVALSGDETKVGFSRQADNGDQKGMYGGLYAAADLGDFYLNGALSYSRFSSDTNRSVAFEGYGATATASYDGNAWLASLGGGWDANLAGWLVGPMAGLDYLSLSEDGFTESGAGFLNLNVQGRDVDYWSSALGVRAAGRYNFGSWALLPRAQLAWRHLFADERRDVKASFSGYGGNSFTVYGLEQVSDSLELQAGLNAAIGQQANVFLQYGLSLGQGQNGQELSLGFNWLF